MSHKGSLGEQLRAIGSEFIFPRDDMARHHWLDDKRLLILAVVGLSLSVLMLLPIGGLLVFYAISLYFAVVWGLFFYVFFRSRQVNVKTTVSVFFLTQIAVFIISRGSAISISFISSPNWPSRSTLWAMCSAWASPRSL